MKPRADVKVARGSSVTFTLPSIHYLYFTYASKVYLRSKLLDRRNRNCLNRTEIFCLGRFHYNGQPSIELSNTVSKIEVLLFISQTRL